MQLGRGTQGLNNAGNISCPKQDVKCIDSLRMLLSMPFSMSYMLNNVHKPH